MRHKNFYSELGKLLYAIADTDGVITPKEKKELIAVVKKEVAGEEYKDEPGTNTPEPVKTELADPASENTDPVAAFDSFIHYVAAHHTAISPREKEVCLTVAGRLAAAYRSTNKKEKQLVEKLYHQLGKIKSRKKRSS